VYDLHFGFSIYVTPISRFIEMNISILLLCIYIVAIYASCNKPKDVSFCEVNYEVECDGSCTSEDTQANSTFWKVLEMWNLGEHEECAVQYKRLLCKNIFMPCKQPSTRWCSVDCNSFPYKACPNFTDPNKYLDCANEKYYANASCWCFLTSSASLELCFQPDVTPPPKGVNKTEMIELLIGISVSIFMCFSMIIYLTIRRMRASRPPGYLRKFIDPKKDDYDNWTKVMHESTNE